MSSTPHGSVPGKPGILFVASGVVHPDVLDPLDFVDWYENTHIQEVQSTGGIAATQRYESLSFHSRKRDSTATEVVENQNLKFDFLTVYNMPDLSFRETEAFNNLDGQSVPNEELLQKLFKQSAFITRFAEEISDSGATTATSGAAPYLLTVSGVSWDSSNSKLPKSPAGRMRKLSVREGSLLSEFERHWEAVPSDIVLIEADDVAQLKKLHGEFEGIDGLEVGFWRLRRKYEGTERTPAGWKPK